MLRTRLPVPGLCTFGADLPGTAAILHCISLHILSRDETLMWTKALLRTGYEVLNPN